MSDELPGNGIVCAAPEPIAGADRGRYVSAFDRRFQPRPPVFCRTSFRLWSVLNTDQAVKFAKPLCQVSSGKFAEMFKFT